jgi:hypothetical protein
MVQCPNWQVPEHVLPQEPQLSVFVVRSMHDPPQQDVPLAHAWPHPPQFELSVCSSTHPEPHAVSPEGHVQVPLTQA